MEGFSILNTGSFLIPHLPRHALGTHYRCSVRIVLLLHVQESGEKPITILPYARIGRYVWVKLHLLINRMGILTLSQAHPRKGALFMFPHSSCGFLIVTITLQRCKSGSYTFEASNAEFGMVQLRVIHIQCESRYSYYKTARIRGNINAGFPVD